ncbi:MAG: helix-turn-helix domain-containing protein [Treponema sp.]|nr:helix-turn-helix domain-containing protein [Treponema sp.]
MREALFQPTKNFDYSFLRAVPAHTMKRQHYHDGYEIYLHLEGAHTICYNNSHYRLQRGMMYVAEPFVLHGTVSESNLYSRNLVNFRLPLFEDFLSAREINRFTAAFKSCILQLNEAQLDEVLRHYDAIDSYWTRKNRHESWCAKLAYMEVYRLTDTICRFRAENADAPAFSPPALVESPGIYRVLRHIEAHYAEELPLEQMLDCACMSQPTFYRAFKRVTGDSFASYLSRYRILKAHMLIAETSLSLGEIAAKTGFPSATTLSRAFHQAFGVAPSQFRKPVHS